MEYCIFLVARQSPRLLPICDSWRQAIARFTQQSSANRPCSCQFWFLTVGDLSFAILGRSPVTRSPANFNNLSVFPFFTRHRIPARKTLALILSTNKLHKSTYMGEKHMNNWTIITDRLKWLYQSIKASWIMSYHVKENAKAHDIIGQPNQSRAWKFLYKFNSDFAPKVENVQLGLCTNRFNPLSNTNSTYLM